MAAPLRFLNSRSGKNPIAVSELFNLLNADALDRVEAEVRAMRESFHAPSSVKDHAEYRHELQRFYAHYHNTFYNSSMDANDVGSMDWNHLQRLHKDIHAVENDAIRNRDGGFIRIIDDITEALVKQKVEDHIDLVLFDYIPRDQYFRMRLSEELMEFIKRWLPNEADMMEPFMFASNIEGALKNFALQLRQIKRPWRW